MQSPGPAPGASAAGFLSELFVLGGQLSAPQGIWDRWLCSGLCPAPLSHWCLLLAKPAQQPWCTSGLAFQVCVGRAEGKQRGGQRGSSGTLCLIQGQGQVLGENTGRPGLAGGVGCMGWGVLPKVQVRNLVHLWTVAFHLLPLAFFS